MNYMSYKTIRDQVENMIKGDLINIIGNTIGEVGVVVTWKEMNDVNGIDKFIRNYTLNGWLVNEIDIDTRVNIHQKVNKEIEFE